MHGSIRGEHHPLVTVTRSQTQGPCTGTVVHPPLEVGTAVLPSGPAVALDPPPGDGTEVDPSGVIGTVVHPPGDGTEVDPQGVTGTVVVWIVEPLLPRGLDDADPRSRERHHCLRERPLNCTNLLRVSGKEAYALAMQAEPCVAVRP